MVFCSNITQVMQVFNAIRAGNLPLWLERTVEVHYREWLIAPPVARPKAADTAHTGFLVHLKRITRMVSSDGSVRELTAVSPAPEEVEDDESTPEVEAHQITSAGRKRMLNTGAALFDVSVRE